MSESQGQNTPVVKAKCGTTAPAAGCFGILSAADLHEAERQAAARRDLPSLEQFAEQYFHTGEQAPTKRSDFEAAH